MAHCLHFVTACTPLQRTLRRLQESALHPGEALLAAVLMQRQGGLPWSEALEVARAVAGHLAQLHGRGQVHGALDLRHVAVAAAAGGGLTAR